MGEENYIDSIMLLRKSPNLLKTKGAKFVMDVFEPLGIDASNLPGSWSTMCGNGLMAIACFYENYFKKLEEGEQIYIQTQSGLRILTKLENGKYSACMGEFTNNFKDLKKYMSSSPFPPNYSELSEFIDSWNIGLSGDRNRLNEIDGEPHLVLIGKKNNQTNNIKRLINIAIRFGQSTTKNQNLFPKEINTDFAIVQEKNKKQMEVLACTYERGLGKHSDHCVTNACGTGATAIGASLYQLYNLNDHHMINVRMPGGLLQVYRDKNQFYLIGAAKKISSVKL